MSACRESAVGFTSCKAMEGLPDFQNSIFCKSSVCGNSRRHATKRRLASPLTEQDFGRTGQMVAVTMPRKEPKGKARNGGAFHRGTIGKSASLTKAGTRDPEGTAS